MTAVHQLLPVLSYGDAIGGATLRTRDMLRRLGFESSIFAEVIDARLRNEALPADRLPVDMRSSDALIYRLSIGSRAATLFELTRAKRIIVYHNITPAIYFRDTNPQVVYWLCLGRDDLRRLAPMADLVLADSHFNLDEARELGARNGRVLPIAMDLNRLQPRAARGSVPPMLLFVGRAAPNKRHDVLLRAVAALRASGRSDCHLVLVGSGDTNPAYVRALGRLAEGLGIADAVTIEARRVSDRELAGHYERADVFATASEHEGFCVPLVEAMSFSLPVVAYGGGAIPETVGPAGMLLHTHDPLVWAAALERALSDQGLRRTLQAAGRARVRDFDPALLMDELRRAVESIGVTA